MLFKILAFEIKSKIAVFILFCLALQIHMLHNTFFEWSRDTKQFVKIVFKYDIKKKKILRGITGDAPGYPPGGPAGRGITRGAPGWAFETLLLTERETPHKN